MPDHPRYLCIHGHFYQPPRENPWLDVVEVQDSATPYHDWNERITRECYAPNARARLLDGEGRIRTMVNNYEWMSFNFGPTLLQWMDQAAPAVVAQLVEADHRSRERLGHGNALAQVYNHMILPLASPRDRRTQVRWGIADFTHRFGRAPEGMWLAETAVDVASLEALAEAGIQFTILAPNQARRWRKIGDKEWAAQPGGIDPSRVYRCKLPSGRLIALFFYDGIIAREVAFERLLDDGQRFLGRLLQGFDPGRGHAQLMHIATDGESYGHHHAHGDMALAYILDHLASAPQVELINYATYLERHPPEWEVEVHESSSWSCAHGVERWRSNCGCRMRGEWEQHWRAPLRQGLDRLKASLDHLFATRGRECFTDPWAARDAFITVMLAEDREQAASDFLSHHGHADLDGTQQSDGLRLLELQRDGMLMFTSCGWFFDELSGLETTQCLNYAARAIHLARAHFGRDFEPALVADLGKAPSNLPQFRDGGEIWRKLIRPGLVDLERVLAHHALISLFEPGELTSRLFSFELETLDREVRSRGGNRVAIGRLRVRDRATRAQRESTFVVIHYGGLDFHVVLRETQPPEVYEPFKQQLLETFRTASLADVTTLVANHFPGPAHRLEDLFRDEQRRIIGIALESRFADYQRNFESLADQDEDLINRLARLDYPIPKPMLAAASAYLDHHLAQAIERLEEEPSLDEIRTLLERGEAWSFQPERELLSKTIAESLDRVLAGIGAEGDIEALTRQAGALLDAAALLAIRLDLWQAQNRFLAMLRGSQHAWSPPATPPASLVGLAERLSISSELLSPIS